MQTATSAVPVSACSEHRANGGVLTQGEEKSKTLRRAPRHQSSPVRVLLSVLSVLFLSPLTSYAQAKYPFDLPAQPLAESLRAVGHQTSTNVMFEPRLVKGLDAPALRTETTPTEAIRLLLAGTELTALQTAASTVLIQRVSTSEKSAPTSQAVAPTGTNGYTRLAQAETNSSAQDVRGESRNSERDNSSRASAEAEKNRIVLEEIVVIGTNIRGVYPRSSPVDIYTAEDIERMGVTTMQGFVERLPQNLGTRTQYGSGLDTVNVDNTNYDAVTSVDLRGLGAGTTLTLLNGRRLSPSDFGQAVDVSMIPLGAIARVEVLTDGASAIYGSDAVGGVINFVLRDDFTGAQTRIDYGGVTSGGLRQGNFSQMFGENWGSGYAVLSYNFYSTSPLERSDRSYAAPAGRGTLTPDEETHAAFLTLSQTVWDRLTLAGDLGFARRDTETENNRLNAFSSVNDSLQISRGESDRAFVNFAVDYRITDALNAALSSSYSKSDLDNNVFALSYNRVPPTSTSADFDTNSSVLDVTAKLDGALVRLPGGLSRFSVGAGMLEEDYKGGLTTRGFASGRDLGRSTTYAFAELFVPLVRRLEISLAGRYTRYDDTSEPPINQDFGDGFDPKIGLLWEPIDGLGLRGTYGTSFRAPALVRTDPTGGLRFLFPLTIAGQPAQNLSVASYPADLEPETAKTYTLGFEFRPPSHPGFRLSATYYNIDYKDRIGTAPTGSINQFVNPELVPDAIYRAPSAAYIQEILGGIPPLLVGVSLPGVDLSNPAAVAAAIFAQPNLWIVDSRLRNLALSKQDGFDVAVSNTFELSLGRIDVGASATKILDYRQQGSLNSPALTVVDYVGLPVSLRGRAHAGLTRGGFNATIGVNYADEYKNRTTTGASTPVARWTTADLNLSYELQQKGILNGLRVSLSATNLFDKDPPFVNQSGWPQVGFDPANANPLGRLVTVGASKKW